MLTWISQTFFNKNALVIMMKALATFMVISMVFVSAFAEYNQASQTVIKEDCCLRMGKDMPCPHQKQNCSRDLCTGSVCNNLRGLTAIATLTVKVFIPSLEKNMFNKHLAKKLSDYSVTFWHPPQV
ncbi:hypothetical protein [Pedobacter gandavensis]|uniref:hypothetical protein n=1 Tax=Pedobacter gandavensis TaxID=2679963 RepID=UPI00292E5352|nr:hypothetical protein [Pedobacter gandavensis]